MKIYDCFIFNNELNLLNLRLHFLNDVVDHFVIVESRQTLSGSPKPLYFHENRHLFDDFLDKIIHVEAPVNNLPVWEYEYFQRNHIKTALKSCSDSDLIVVSDADEIINLREILPILDKDSPYLVELPMYYYWFNLKTTDTFLVNPIAPWKHIKTLDIGERYNTYPKLFPNVITTEQACTGWHFSYLFGTDVTCYQSKIKSFSHNEYDTPYYLNPDRIRQCIALGVDLFERPFVNCTYSKKDLTIILPYLEQTGLQNYIYNPPLKTYIEPKNVVFLLRRNFKKISWYCKKEIISNLKKVIMLFRKRQ